MGGVSAKTLVGGVLLLLGVAACGAKPARVTTPIAARPDPNADVVRYCAGTVTEWDEHRCIWELTPEQQRHRALSQRLTIRGGKLARLETITGTGDIREGEESSEYEYAGHSVAAWTSLNRNGVVKGSARLSEDGDWVRWLDAEGRPRAKSGTKVSGLRRSFDARGRVLGYVYVDWLGNPARDSGAVFEKRLKLNQIGAVVEESFFGRAGEAVLGPAGAHRVEHVVDAHGMETERRYFDPGGQPMAVKGIGIVRSKYDAFGNTIEDAYFTLEGRPALDPEAEAALVRKKRDESGNEIERQRFDEQGKLVVDAPHGAVRKTYYDEHGWATELSYFGADGAPESPPALGYATMRQSRDARGNVVSLRYFDEKAAPMLLPAGYHGVQTAFDARDNPISYRYVDERGAPIMLPRGYYARQLTYAGDRVIHTDFLDVNGKVTDVSDVSYADDGSEITSPECRGKVSPELVALISARVATARSCYERLLVRVPDAAGRLVVAMHVEPDGKVTVLSMVDESLRDDELANCVKGKLLADLPRGPDDGCAEFNVPLKFEPKTRNGAATP